MADFNFASPQQQLFGGVPGMAWEPLGQEGNLKPYQQDLSFDLYHKLSNNSTPAFDYTPPVSMPNSGYMPLGSGNPFQQSVMGDGRRQEAAQQSFAAIQQNMFDPVPSGNPIAQGMQQAQNTFAPSSNPMGGFGSNPVAQGQMTAERQAAYDAGMSQLGQSNLRDTAFGQMAGWLNQPQSTGSPFDQRRAELLQNLSGQPRPNSVLNPNFDGTNNAFDYSNPSTLQGGFERFKAGLEGADIFSQGNVKSKALDQMAGWLNSPGGGGNDPVGEATETISKLAKVMKDDLIPATKDYTDQVSRTVQVMGGGSSGGGGIGGFGGGGGGGGITPYNGDFNQSGWFSDARPEVMANYGIGNGMPRFTDSDFQDDGGVMGKTMSRLTNPDRLAYSLRRSRIAYSMIAQPAFDDADTYRSQMASQDIMGVQSGMMNYNDLMGGEYGQLTRRATNVQERTLALGRQVDMAYGGIADMALGPNAANGPLGAAYGIGAPAAGVGLAAATLTGSALAGGVIGGGMAIAGAIGYATSAGQDAYEMGRWQDARDDGQRVDSSTFRGAVGQAASTWAALTGDGANNRNIRANAKTYFNNVNAFAAGDMPTADLKNWATQNNFNPAVAVGAGYDTFLGNNASSYGWAREEQQQVLGLDLKYNSKQMPKATGLFGMQMALGSNFNQWMEKALPSIASSMGVGGGDPQQYDLMGMYSSRAYDIQQSGGNVDLYQQALQGQINPIGQINQLRYRAGYGNSKLGLDNYLNQSPNPDVQGALQDTDAMRFGYQGSDPSFAQNVSNPLTDIADYYTKTGKADLAGRIQNNIPGMQAAYRRASGFGNDISSAQIRYAQIDALHPEQGAAIDLMASGNRMALSQNAGLLGDDRYRTLDVNTGLGIYEQEKRSLQDTSTNIGRNLDTYQYNMATSARNIGYQTQVGGATGVNAQGVAIGGDGLAGLSSLFAAQGMNLQTGNGMGMWQVEDASTALSRQQQQYRMDQGGVTLGIQGANRDLAARQYNESYAMNQQQFTMQTQYQSQNMTIGRGQDIQQAQWQNEDMGMSRNRMELSYGWQQEDYDRNIRFARGRQRVDLMREQERSTISHAMDETQQGNTEQRAKTVQQWQTDEYERKKQYFDESKTLAQQEMELNKRHHDEKLALDNASFEITKQNHEKEKEWMTQQWALEDQRRLLVRQNEELQYKSATDLAEAGRAATLQLDAIATQLRTIGRTEDDNNAFINKNVDNGTTYKGAVNGYTPPSAPAPKPATPAPTPKHVPGGGYAEGGYTGSGPSGGVAGIVHNNEYVVPEGGALVVRGGGSESLAPYLIKMISILEKGIINANIYTNADSVNMKDVYSQAGTRFKK